MDNSPVKTELDITSLDWYHTIDLGGIVTPGHFDHRPYLHHYGLPDDLTGKRVLDIGAASGFFSFEFERRGARVTATDLPAWFDHDFGPNYRPDQTAETGDTYLHQPFELAKQVLGAHVVKQYINIYDIGPETVGEFDIVFCGSVLVHLTDPIKALWNIARVTREKAIIATVIMPDYSDLPLAMLIGHQRGDGWWIPSRAGLELMVACAGFVGIEWFDDFRLDYRNGDPGPYHGVIHAYKTREHWTPRTVDSQTIIQRRQTELHRHDPQKLANELVAREQEIERLNALIKGYERGRFIRFMRWLKDRGQNQAR